ADVRIVDVGELADADPGERDDAEEHRAKHQHPREDGIPDRDVGDAHSRTPADAAPGGLPFGPPPAPRRLPLAEPAGAPGPPGALSPPSALGFGSGGAPASSEERRVARILAPGESASAPWTTIQSPALRPERTSTQPSFVL